MMPENDYLKMHTESVLEYVKKSQELQAISMELEKTRSEIRRIKIDILKNGKREDKINLLIQERLEELMEEEKTMVQPPHADAV